MATVVTLLAAAPAMASEVRLDSTGELLYMAASNVENNVTISGGGASLTISDPADPITPATPACTNVDATTVTCDGTPVRVLNVQLRAGNDTATNSSTFSAFLHGNNGNDTLIGGDNWDVLKGWGGNDVLNARGGNDTLIGDGDPAVGDDQMDGGDGVDMVSFATAAPLRVDLSAPGAQDTGDGLDLLTGIENVNGSPGNDVLIGSSAPNTLLGKGGSDEIRIRGGGSDSAGCGSGDDLVVLDRTDTLADRASCETVDDGENPNNTQITAGPTGPTADPTWSFTSDEPWAGFECTVVDAIDDPATGTWAPCRSGEPVAAAEGVAQTFAVRAVDDQGNVDQFVPRSFTLDTTAPETRIDSAPSGTISDPTPEFSFSSDDSDVTGFLCRFDTGSFFVCSSPLIADPLSNGEHTLEVVATDVAGNFDNTPAKATFLVDTAGLPPGPGDGPAPNPQGGSAKPPVQQAKIIIGSLVLISGNSVKMTRKGQVSISLTCAGAKRCSGRLSITTAAPVGKKNRKLVTLGTKRFGIAANKKRRIKVKFSKSKIRLVKRLKRFKAKALIREVDERGNPRISSRIFVLRAR